MFDIQIVVTGADPRHDKIVVAMIDGLTTNMSATAWSLNAKLRTPEGGDRGSIKRVNEGRGL